MSWPQIIAFYSPGPTLLGWAYLAKFNQPGSQPGENATVRQIRYHNGGVEIQWSTQDEGDPGAISSLDYSASLHLSGHKIVASSLIATTERRSLEAFLTDLSRGDQAAADRLAAPSVGTEAAVQFRAYPSALNATPKCYGLNDSSTSMPTPVAALVDLGGPEQASPAPDRLCVLRPMDSGANWIALGMRHTGFRTWQILWLRTV